MTKFNKNKIMIFSTVIAACTISYADADEFYPETKNVDTVSYLDESVKEANDDIYIEFVNEKEDIPTQNNVEKLKRKKLIKIDILLLNRIIMGIWRIILKDWTTNT